MRAESDPAALAGQVLYAVRPDFEGTVCVKAVIVTAVTRLPANAVRPPGLVARCRGADGEEFHCLLGELVGSRVAALLDAHGREDGEAVSFPFPVVTLRTSSGRRYSFPLEVPTGGDSEGEGTGRWGVRAAEPTLRRLAALGATPESVELPDGRELDLRGSPALVTA